MVDSDMEAVIVMAAGSDTEAVIDTAVATDMAVATVTAADTDMEAVTDTAVVIAMEVDTDTVAVTVSDGVVTQTVTGNGVRNESQKRCLKQTRSNCSVYQFQLKDER